MPTVMPRRRKLNLWRLAPTIFVALALPASVVTSSPRWISARAATGTYERGGVMRGQNPDHIYCLCERFAPPAVESVGGNRCAACFGDHARLDPWDEDAGCNRIQKERAVRAGDISSSDERCERYRFSNILIRAVSSAIAVSNPSRSLSKTVANPFCG